MHAMQTEIKSLKESQESLIKELLPKKRPEQIEPDVPTSERHLLHNRVNDNDSVVNRATNSYRTPLLMKKLPTSSG